MRNGRLVVRRARAPIAMGAIALTALVLWGVTTSSSESSPVEPSTATAATPLPAAAGSEEVALGEVSPSATPQDADRPGRPPRTLKDLPDAVAARIVTPDVARRLEAGDSVDAVVVFDGDDVRRSADLETPAGGDRRSGIHQRLVEGFRTLKQRALRSAGVSVLESYDGLGVAFARISSASALLAIANDPFVSGIRLPETLTTNTTESLGVIRQAEVAAAGQTGTGTTIAIIDTGVNYASGYFGTCTAPGSAGCRVIEARDFATDDGKLDDNGHGTNVAGVATTVAPGARILAYDVFQWTYYDDLQRWGFGASETHILNALARTISVASTYNVRALNMSLGTIEDRRWTTACDTWDGYVNPYRDVLKNARLVGIVPVISAGNNSYLSSGAFGLGVARPACTPGAVSVGATFDETQNVSLTWKRQEDVGPQDECTSTLIRDTVTCYSQTGPNLSLFAPGSCIVAAGIGLGTCYGGTSQAAPHVAGAAAVLAAAAPGASVDSIVSALTGSGPLILDARTSVQKRRLDLPAALARISIDLTPPVITSVPALRIPTGVPVASDSGTPIRFSWQGSDDVGIDHYEAWISRSTTGSWEWVPLPTPTNDTVVVPALRPSSDYGYQFAVRAVDRAGNASGWAYYPSPYSLFYIGIVYENSTSIKYSGSGWTRAAWQAAHGGYFTVTGTKGAYARYTVSGRSAVAWFGTKAPYRGIAQVILNGSLITTVDLYNSDSQPRQLIWSFNLNPAITHTYDVKLTGTPTDRPRVDVDGFVVVTVR